MVQVVLREEKKKAQSVDFYESNLISENIFAYTFCFPMNSPSSVGDCSRSELWNGRYGQYYMQQPKRKVSFFIIIKKLNYFTVT